MAKTCPSCGYQNADAAKYCVRCGATLSPTGQAPTQPTNFTSMGSGQYQPQAGGGTPTPTTPPTTIAMPQQPPQPPPYSRQDFDGLTRIRIYGLIGILGIFLTLAVSVLDFRVALLTLRAASPSPHPALETSFLGRVFLLTGLGVGAAISVAAFIFLYSGMRSISMVDSSLRTPTTLLVLLPLGLALLFVGFSLILGSSAALNQPPAGVSVGLLAAGGLLVFVSLVALLVGAIGGEILGLWRIGSRYGESLIKIGAILLIVPFINFVAPILVLLGANEAIRKVEKSLGQPSNI